MVRQVSLDMKRARLVAEGVQKYWQRRRQRRTKHGRPGQAPPLLPTGSNNNNNDNRLIINNRSLGLEGINQPLEKRVTATTTAASGSAAAAAAEALPSGNDGVITIGTTEAVDMNNNKVIGAEPQRFHKHLY